MDRLEVADFAFDIEMLWRLKKANRRILEVATVWSDRAAGTTIRLLPASWAMFKSLVRIRLRDSALWYVPFVDYFGRRGVIRVVRGHRMLLLGTTRTGARHDAQLEQFLSLLEAAGTELVDASESGSNAVSPWTFFGWYIFASRRDYDAVIEAADHQLWIVPWLSVKPSFIVATRDRRWTEKHRHWYTRSTFIDLDSQDARSAAEMLLATSYLSTRCPAAFSEKTGTLSLQYPDRETGAPTKHVLR